MRNYLHVAIRKLRPNSEFAISNDDYSTITWIKLEGQAPSQKEVDEAIEQVKADEIAEEEAKAVKRAELLSRLGITEEEARILLG